MKGGLFVDGAPKLHNISRLCQAGHLHLGR